MYSQAMDPDALPTAAEANSLSQAASSYLRSARHQPVEWHAWGEAAFARAKAEDKPILLDIGAVWCHWCHVMDRESYEDAELARIVNEHYIAVKVDRDERPDHRCNRKDRNRQECRDEQRVAQQALELGHTGIVASARLRREDGDITKHYPQGIALPPRTRK